MAPVRPPDVANLGATTTTPAHPTVGAKSSPDTNARYHAAFAYVDCMRKNGIANFPDPTSGGQINVKFATGGKDGAPSSSGIDRMSPQYISADQMCRHLLPGGAPTPAQKQLALANELKYAQCMRGHGVVNFPDPTSAGVLHILSVDPNSPQYRIAQKTCQNLVPGLSSK